MILILCHLHDADARWLYQRLQRATSPESVAIISTDELLYAHRIQHTVSPSGVDFRFHLQNGRILEKKDLSLVINRLCYIDPLIWKWVGTQQYQYVSQELNALYLSLLHALTAIPLYNPPTATWLGGRHLSPAEWQLLALRLELPIPPNWPPADEPAQPDQRVLIVDGQLLGELPTGISLASCQQLAGQSGMPLLELQFTDAVFVQATPMPLLQPYGTDIIDYLLTSTANGTHLGHTERIAHSTPA
jgi:hypothetical protein